MYRFPRYRAAFAGGQSWPIATPIKITLGIGRVVGMINRGAEVGVDILVARMTIGEIMRLGAKHPSKQHRRKQLGHVQRKRSPRTGMATSVSETTERER